MKKRYKILLIVLAVLVAVGFGRFAYRKWAPDYMKIDYVFKGYTETDGYLNMGLGDWQYYAYYSYPDDISSTIEASGKYERVTPENIDTVRAVIDAGKHLYNYWGNGDPPINKSYPRPNDASVSTDDYFILEFIYSQEEVETMSLNPYHHFYLVYYSAADRCIYDLSLNT
ncbi:MAG: hypothetical protein IJL26_11025 [Clostridia bacterium]|nr:hypothetical protein [Clostridia bacterium]